MTEFVPFDKILRDRDIVYTSKFLFALNHHALETNHFYHLGFLSTYFAPDHRAPLEDNLNAALLHLAAMQLYVHIDTERELWYLEPPETSIAILTHNFHNLSRFPPDGSCYHNPNYPRQHS